MNRATFLTLPCLLVVFFASALCWGEDFLLYSPKPATGEQAPASPDQGVLVKTVTIKRGDTLKNISRKYTGRAAWFAQVLLFNNIKNPDLIHVGDKVRVPVGPGKSVSEKSNSGKHSAAVKRHSKGAKRHHAKRATARHRAEAAPEQTRTPAATPDEQGRYYQARRAYVNGEYQKSLELFTAFLHNYPRSSYSADAALYRADCYLRLAGE